MVENRKILFVIGGMGKGGAERVISILANHYIEKGWKVSIVVLLSNAVEYELNCKIKIIDLTFPNRSYFRSLPYWMRGIRKSVKSFSPDIVVAFVARINIITQISCVGLHKKIIISERNDPHSDGRGLLTVLGTKIFYPYAEKLILQTKRSGRCFGKRIQKNSIVIPNPVEVQEYASKCKKKKIVSVGRLAKQKNQKLLIRSFAEIRKEFPEYELWIYGEGEVREELEKLGENLGISDKLFLPGVVDDIHHQIADADVFVLSSDYEGLSNALLEALMMGLPCISTNCAGADEIIEDGKNGILIPIGDEVKLIAALSSLLKDEKKKEKLANAAYYTAKRYEASEILIQWDAVICQI